jgi:hypothetical protein
MPKMSNKINEMPSIAPDDKIIRRGDNTGDISDQHTSLTIII